MSGTAFELESTFTGPNFAEGDRWMSTVGELEESGFAPVSEFDWAIHRMLNELASLKSNWDSEGALRIDRRVMEAAREFVSAIPGRIKAEIAAPTVVPMRKGNLQFEWHAGPRTLELELETPGQVHYLKWHPEAGVEEEDIVPLSDTETIAELLTWFMRG